MTKPARKRPEPVSIPDQPKTNFVLTNNGTFAEGDLVINRDGLLIAGESPASTRPSSVGSSSASGSLHVRNPSAGDTPSTAQLAERLQADARLYNITLNELLEVCIIGSGSSGVVHKVQDKVSGKMLVRKVIQFEPHSDQLRKQVTTELRTLYGASSPYVVTSYQSFFANGAITILMEYMDGGSLADVLKKHKKLPEKYIAEIARQVIAGLTYLHKELKVVHRDIKPSNLLLNSLGQLKISDFGVSGQLTSSVSQCLSWVGTVTYMSPERINGDSYSFDSDVWSLGLSLLECALGRFPYPPPGEVSTQLGFWELLEYIVHHPPPQLPAEQFSPELCDFVSRCLRKDPSDRPAIAALQDHPFLKAHRDANLAELVHAAS